MTGDVPLGHILQCRAMWNGVGFYLFDPLSRLPRFAQFYDGSAFLKSSCHNLCLVICLERTIKSSRLSLHSLIFACEFSSIDCLLWECFERFLYPLAWGLGAFYTLFCSLSACNVVQSCSVAIDNFGTVTLSPSHKMRPGYLDQILRIVPTLNKH